MSDRFKAFHATSAKDVRTLHDVVTLNQHGLANPSQTFDGIACVYLVTAKLDQETRELWEREVVSYGRCSTSGKATMPTGVQVMHFVSQRARTLEHSPVNAAKVLGGAVPKKGGAYFAETEITPVKATALAVRTVKNSNPQPSRSMWKPSVLEPHRHQVHA